MGRTTVVAVKVPDKPGGLFSILDVLSNQGVNVEYMYAFVQQSGENAILIFRFDRTDQAIEILQKNNIPIVPGKDIYTI